MPLKKPKTHGINEAMDKTQFLDWLQEESFIAALSNEDVNRICQRWIRHKIRQTSKVDKP